MLRRVRRSVVTLIVALALAGCGAPADENGLPGRAAAAGASADGGAAAGQSSGERRRAGPRRERQITAMLNRATRATIRADRRCAVRPPPESRTTYTDARPSDELLAAFALLRRPQTEQERIADELIALPAQHVYRSAYRIATSASGRQYLLVVAQDGNGFTSRPPECADAFRARLEEELAGRGARFKREARKALEQVIRDEWTGRPGAAEPFEGLYLFDYREGAIGGGGGGGSLDSLRRSAPVSATGSNRSSIVSALVPDGVATVEMTFPRVVSRGPSRPARRYKRAFTVTAPVHDNVISVSVPRPPDDASAARTVWKDAEGDTVKVFRRPR